MVKNCGRQNQCRNNLNPAISSGEGNGNPLQYSCLENPMDGEAWLAAVHEVVKSWTQLSDFTFTFTHWRRKWQFPLQCSCLENPRDGGAWWAAIYGVTQSRTQLKRLSSSSSAPLPFIKLYIYYLVFKKKNKKHKFDTIISPVAPFKGMPSQLD